MFQFTYDAWNRLVKVTKAYRDPEDSYNLKANMVVNTLEYDALNRRIKKAVQNSGPLDCTYHYYYDGQRIVETHNGSEQVIQQFVWGQTYIDELVQIGLNDDPTDLTEQDIETTYFAMSNANFNVMGLVDDSGAMVERYEYTPYGERQVYISSGINDPDCYAPIKKSQRAQSVGGVVQPWGINPVGHQGLFHDAETQLIHNRYRMLHSRLGRFIQRDPMGYVDGMNQYEYVRSNPANSYDPLGNQTQCVRVDTFPPVLIKTILRLGRMPSTRMPLTNWTLILSRITGVISGSSGGSVGGAMASQIGVVWERQFVDLYFCKYDKTTCDYEWGEPAPAAIDKKVDIPQGRRFLAITANINLLPTVKLPFLDITFMAITQPGDIATHEHFAINATPKAGETMYYQPQPPKGAAEVSSFSDLGMGSMPPILPAPPLPKPRPWIGAGGFHPKFNKIPLIF